MIISEENYLRHYGVLGMKWGVRKNSDRAYSKSIKKLKKLDAKSNKTALKGAKLSSTDSKSRLKAAKLRAKASKAMTAKGYQKRMQKAERLEYKALKNEAKGDKYKLASAKYERKAQKWASKMNETFSGVSVSNISASDITIGKKYAVSIVDEYVRKSQ